MTLTEAQLATRHAWPAVFTKRSYPGVPNPNKQDVVLTMAALVRADFANVATADTDGVSASHAGAASAGTTSMTIGGALASGGVATFTTPRNVVITVTHATSVVAMSGTITGTDEYGNVITEAWSVTATGMSKVFTGKKAFKTVTAITEVVAADASANTIIAGNGVVLGLPFKAACPVIVAETEDGAVPTAGVLVAASTAGTADARGTYAPNSAPNGALDFSVWFIVEDIDLT